MGAFQKADFYYGAFLSHMINKGLVHPILIEKEAARRKRFRLSTKNGNYELYCKYATTSTGTKNLRWSFTFSPNEISEIRELLESDKDVYFALICAQPALTASEQEVALVSKQVFQKCVELDAYKGSAPRISVLAVKHSNKLGIYGNKRSDKKEQKDNTIKIERNGMIML